MPDLAKVRDIMTTKVLTVGSDDTLEVATKLFEQYDYDGIPVIDNQRKLVGIITAYDMVVQSSGMHLPTLMEIMRQMSANKADKKDIDEHFTKLRQIKIKEVMNTQPLVVGPDLSIEELARVFAEHHRVNPIPVVDDQGILVGLLSRYDIIRFFNERYFQQVVGEVSTVRGGKGAPEAINATVQDISKEFLIVNRRRPRIWKYAAIGAFIAGLVVATAMIIRIVRDEETVFMPRTIAVVISTLR
ncbi:MAG: CBS domain-containing protein [Candidatus Paceibacterota bacterium]|nr:MAG: CBS domain-containing protein [Candidatus Paceibacterota bacterium]